ncbi:MAG TPA: adenylosuccinate synthase, partial [Candidatus Binatia bacterium]|nr:adenylosuccinate synthase [Candidatus Binatia bacterium]
DIVARYSGGDNAGHTVTIGEEVFKLHLIPSGIVHERPVCLIGNGVAVNPSVLCEEIRMLQERGVDVGPERVLLSRQAHLITPAHIALDKARESTRGEAIGTTLRGIGPAYMDKSGREGLRAALLEDPEVLCTALSGHVQQKNKILQWLFGEQGLDAEAIVGEFARYADRLAPHLVESVAFVHRALQENRRILAEGAQGTLLDLDHGTYPFVTSSHPISGGALIGLGVGPSAISRVIGVAKAFTTRVGSGPFPTELSGERAVRLRGTGENPWDEYGTTTGRPRRVGWLDTVILRHAVRVNGLTELALTKLDILSGWSELEVCVAYRLEGQLVDYLPSELQQLERVEPVYERLPGWQEDISDARHLLDLPDAARRYIDFVAAVCGVPVTIMSVGPARHQVIWDRQV